MIVALPEEKVAAKTVLVVDDDQPISELVRLVLETRGYNIRVAFDGKNALKLARRFRPDLMVLDIMMPGIHGFDVLKFLKEDPDLSGIKVVILTARALEVDRQKALEGGADAYLTKPIRLADLLDTVNGLLFPSAS